MAIPNAFEAGSQDTEEVYCHPPSDAGNMTKRHVADRHLPESRKGR